MDKNKNESGELRALAFESLRAAVSEVQLILNSGYTRHGRWTLGQICRHLRLVQDLSIDGYPWWMSLFAPLRPIMRRVLLPRIVSGDSPKGLPTSRMFVPPENVDDEFEVNAFIESVARFESHDAPFQPHPGFGRLDTAMLETLHAAHAAHHLRFLTPTPQ